MSAPIQARSIQIGSTLEPAATQAGRKAANYLSGLQARDGHWCGELTVADTTLESGYILFQLWLYPSVEGKWTPETRPLIDKAVRSILDAPLPESIDAGVQAYGALKLAGLPVGDSRMARLRQDILDAGGIQAAGSRLKIHLSLFNLYPAEDCPHIPVELILLPFDFIYQMAAWERTVAVPLSIVQSANRRRPVPAGFNLDELILNELPNELIPNEPGLNEPDLNEPIRAATVRERSAPFAQNLLQWWERHGSKTLRQRAVEKAKDWMLERLRHSDGLGATYPAMMYSVMALDALGYREDDPLRVAALRQFNSLMVDDGDQFFFQPRFSPAWDTALAACALAQRDPADAALPQAADWLLAREVRRKGDWSWKRPNTEPSGWAFEYSNEFYPGTDATAMALLALSQAQASDGAAQKACEKRGLAWLLAMQSADGGWAAFDADHNWRFLDRLPFAGGGGMLDTSCPDITGRALEALAAQGVSGSHTAMVRGVKWLVDHQEADGSWLGRWGVAYIYGTCLALRGLAAAGESDREAHVLRAGEWLRSIQNADGGWGESGSSCERGAEGQSRGQGVFAAAPSTPSQTAWATMGLIAGGDANSLSVQHGIEYLLETQREDGSWADEPATGAGVTRGSYLNYHLYKDYFPLLALSSFVKARANAI
ncbi:MAG TPA: squalene--hopene cyclase [Candidatus Acidoferrales bacterium]|nr:squalene--hopene cyclase [Candidatus Acidoferrales bacterium]